ncbi:hypothetical protein [Streptomyces canus]|uniref:hypothetical protein n=1 Tax=Streptomyces canus TaxID=58343 RepID=UPI0030E47BBF
MRTFVSGLVLNLLTLGLAVLAPRAGGGGRVDRPAAGLFRRVLHRPTDRPQTGRRPSDRLRAARAADAPLTFLDADPNTGDRYAAAPQVFSIKDQAHPGSWSAPRSLFDSRPPVLTKRKGSGIWLDFWTICARSDCCLACLEQVEAVGLGERDLAVVVGEEDWRRYVRAWTADSPGGTWTPRTDTEANAFIVRAEAAPNCPGHLTC